jgi:hypothetical protein
MVAGQRKRDPKVVAYLDAMAEVEKNQPEIGWLALAMYRVDCAGSVGIDSDDSKNWAPGVIRAHYVARAMQVMEQLEWVRIKLVADVESN